MDLVRIGALIGRETMTRIEKIQADINIDRLAEICEAEREGRLRILVRHSVPHNTKAYFYDRYDELQQGKIIHCEGAYAMRFICETNAFNISNYDIGRNVFLTREEAEKALAKMEANNENNND